MTSCAKQSEKRVVLRGVQTSYCMPGDLILEFNEQQYHESWHSYRSVARKELSKAKQYMEVQLGRKKGFDKGKELIVLDMLKNGVGENKNAGGQKQVDRRFVENMSRYCQIINIQDKILNQVRLLTEANNTANNELIEMRQSFLKDVKMVIEKDISKSHDFYVYSILSNNYQGQVQEKNIIGYSQKLMLLLARSIEDFEHRYLKTRSAEVFDPTSIKQLFNCQIEESLSSICSITTLDNIQLQLEVNLRIQCHPSNEFFAAKYNLPRSLFKDAVVVFYFIKVEQKHLDLLYKTRKSQKSSQTQSQNLKNLNNPQLGSFPTQNISSSHNSPFKNQTNNFPLNQKLKMEENVSQPSDSPSIDRGGINIKMECERNQMSNFSNRHSNQQEEQNEIISKFYSNQPTQNSLSLQEELDKIKQITLSKQRRNISSQKSSSSQVMGLKAHQEIFNEEHAWKEEEGLNEESYINQKNKMNNYQYPIKDESFEEEDRSQMNYNQQKESNQMEEESIENYNNQKLIENEQSCGVSSQMNLKQEQ